MERHDRLTIVRLRLMLDEPYLASALARLPFLDASGTGWCDTMATDGYHIFYNRTFADGLTDDELKFVIAHELFHCVLGHLDRRGDRDALLWNFAIDFATNALLSAAGLQMPRAGLFSRTYAAMTAEEIYDALLQRLARAGSRRAAVVAALAGQSGKDSSARARRASGDRLKRKGPPSRQVDGAPGGFDLHLAPGDDRTKTLAASAGNMLSAEERRRLRAMLNKDLLQKLQGTAAGRAVAEVHAATERAVPWEALLRQFFTGLRRTDYRLFPFNKKHLWRGLYLPTLGAPGPQHLVVAVDTSGSMSDEDLAKIAGELDSLRSVSECPLTVLQFDVVVTQVEVREAFQSTVLASRRKFVGRGGTDITAPFVWLAAEIRAGRLFPPPDAIIVITDGFGPIPSAPPLLPVLWIATASARLEFPFGTTIRLPPTALGQRRTAS